MVKAIKRKHVDVAQGISLNSMTPDDIVLMNREFAEVTTLSPHIHAMLNNLPASLRPGCLKFQAR